MCPLEKQRASAAASSSKTSSARRRGQAAVLYKNRFGDNPESTSDVYIHTHPCTMRLVSAAGTGFFYVKRKNPRRITEKLEFRKTSAAPQVLPDLAISAVKQHWDFSGLLFITRITGPGLLIAAF
uniref:Uncharacterized protein n=1 Tax=Oryza rufipogon TaxID=4529 RepID=A0A0E0PNC4_ORYRU